MLYLYLPLLQHDLLLNFNQTRRHVLFLLVVGLDLLFDVVNLFHFFVNLLLCENFIIKVILAVLFDLSVNICDPPTNLLQVLMHELYVTIDGVDLQLIRIILKLQITYLAFQ